MCQYGYMGGVSAQPVHNVHMAGGNWGFLLQLAIFLPLQTMLHPHNVGQLHLLPHPNPMPPNACKQFI